MGRWIELSCVSCEAPLGRRRGRRISVGSPFESCPRCGAFVARPASNEWDLLSPRERARYLLQRAAFPLALGSLPCLLYVAAAAALERERDARIVLALLAAGAVAFVAALLSVTLRTVRRSRRRMADPMYRARLMEFARRAVGRAGSAG